MGRLAPLFVVVALALGGLAFGCSGVRRSPEAQPPPDPSGGTASSAPPSGLAASQVPQFVVLGFDDNGTSGMPGSPTTGGIRFVVDLLAGRRNPAGGGNPQTYDDTPARVSFYVTTRYLEEVGVDRPEYVKRALRAAVDAGHEIALHTHQHAHGSGFSSAQWGAELVTCADWLARPFDAGRSADPATGLGVPADVPMGFRAPFLEYGPPLFPALREHGVAYDCSVETGFEPRYDGGNLPWPYRVAPDFGGGGGSGELWELQVYALIVPPDAECERYGVARGLRQRLHEAHDYFEVADGKITGFDWNL
ncbi:MAG TPA: polysaccharide deacetylase family protein, partial [Thermoanaerobaculia bacterium]|nr:polysaccharide deacetylase family protein [Thermoanaerobaculia bacterium]